MAKVSCGWDNCMYNAGGICISLGEIDLQSVIDEDTNKEYLQCTTYEKL